VYSPERPFTERSEDIVYGDGQLVSFMDCDLGYIDLEEKTLQPLNNRFGPKCGLL
jgi:hypothetical protein